MTEDDAVEPNVGFKQFARAVDSYAATNPLRPWATFQ